MNYLVILNLTTAGVCFLTSILYQFTQEGNSLLAAGWFINACIWSINAGLNWERKG